MIPQTTRTDAATDRAPRRVRPAVRDTLPVSVRPATPGAAPSAPVVEAIGHGQRQRVRPTGTPRQSGPAPVRTVLLVVGGTTAGAGTAGFLAGFLSSALPFQILAWGALGGSTLVVVVKTGRAVAARLPGGSR